ncbi:MAG: response regulator [bacterium]|nr:response regulator [bacterium]
MKGKMDNVSSPRILVVDDDKELLISFKIWLKGEGFATLTASNSDEALAIMEEEPVQVALLDFRLGTENGLDVAQMLSKADENLKIIIITGYPSYDSAVEAIKAGLFDYLSKGSSNGKILETIKKALRKREKEMLEKGNNPYRQEVFKFIVICRHSLIKERLDNFSANYPAFKMIRAFDSMEQLEERAHLPEANVAMVCATCCIPTFEDTFPFFYNLYKYIPNVKPVLFNDYFSESQKVELIRSGVKGFFSVDLGSEKLEKALTLIKNGEIWSDRRLVNLAIPDGTEYIKERLAGVETYGLSAREKEILKAMVLGLKNKEIADKLFISEVTVKSHLHRIFKKFGVNNRTTAIRFARENKIL